MKKKTGIFIGGAALVSVLGFSAFQTFADQTEPIEPAQEMHVASETGEEEGQAVNETGNETQEQQENWYDGVLTIQEAKEIAQDESQGKVIEIELDKEDGRLIYEIELINENQEVEIDIDAVTGEVLEVEKDSADREKQAVWNEEFLSIEEAKEIALAEFEGKVVEMELDKEDGRLVYEVELINGSKEAEIDLDAKTGEILEIEIEIEK